jgi:hypothetical protein
LPYGLKNALTNNHRVKEEKKKSHSLDNKKNGKLNNSDNKAQIEGGESFMADGCGTRFTNDG